MTERKGLRVTLKSGHRYGGFKGARVKRKNKGARGRFGLWGGSSRALLFVSLCLLTVLPLALLILGLVGAASVLLVTLLTGFLAGLLLSAAVLYAFYRMMNGRGVLSLTRRPPLDTALEENETRFRTLASVAFEGVVIHDAGVILEVNRAAAEMSGYTADELVGMDVLKLTAPEDRALIRERMRVEGPVPYEVRARRKDGSVFPVEVLGRTVPYQGRTVRVAALRDVSLRKAAEAALNEKRRELERANQALKEANGRKTDVLTFVSHELRTPLGAVLGFAELLQHERVGPLNDKQQGYVRDIRESGEHLLSLTNDLLDLSKLEVGKLTLAKKVADASVVAAGALTLLREGAAERGLLLHAALPEEAPLLHADPLKLKQVLLNLLANAVAHTPPGGRVTLSLEADADAVTFAVTDTGVGIAKEDLAGLFEPFAQVGSEQPGSAGLGLALSRKLVELHGGEMRVESTPGEGSTFSFTLPRGLNEASVKRAAPSEGARPA